MGTVNSALPILFKMPPPNKHKQKASREWQKKHGIVQPKVSKKQKEKDNLKKLESNWDSYDEIEDDEEIGKSMEELLSSAKPASSFKINLHNNFVPALSAKLSLQDFEKNLQSI